jgi:hypothetical protein
MANGHVAVMAAGLSFIHVPAEAMPMTPQMIGPLIATPLIALAIYRRVRGSFGKQPIRGKRMIARVAILGILAVLLGLSGFHNLELLEGLVGGILGGAVLGYVGLRLTRFETTAEGDRYIPNPWIGALLTVLLVGRLAWRFMVTMPAMDAAHQGPALGNSPLTLAVFGLTVGYYMAYYIGLLVHHRRWRATLPAGSFAD